jgi:DNA-binding NarL/FixJ family response regulator
LSIAKRLRHDAKYVAADFGPPHRLFAHGPPAPDYVQGAANTGIDRRNRAMRLTNSPIEPFAPREHEVLTLVGTGDSNKTIARRLDISANTVKSIRSRLR